MFDGVAEKVDSARPVEDPTGQAGVYGDDDAVRWIFGHVEKVVCRNSIRWRRQFGTMFLNYCQAGLSDVRGPHVRCAVSLGN